MSIAPAPATTAAQRQGSAKVAQPLHRVVLDTNTILRGLVSRHSAAAQVRRAAEDRLFIPLMSKPVLDEYRAVFSDSDLTEKFSELTPELVEITIRRLRFISDYVRIPAAKFQTRAILATRCSSNWPLS